MSYISWHLGNMGLIPGLDFSVYGAARYAHRLNQNSTKQGDSSLGPFANDGWPSMVIEAGWSESLGHLHRDASWWLTAESAPNNPKLILLITFLRRARTFRMERYELRQTTTPATWTAPTGVREVPTLIEAVDIDLRSTPPTIIGAPLTIPFKGIMRRDPVGQERNISLDAAYLGTWALRMAAANKEC